MEAKLVSLNDIDSLVCKPFDKEIITLYVFDIFEGLLTISSKHKLQGCFFSWLLHVVSVAMYGCLQFMTKVNVVVLLCLY